MQVTGDQSANRRTAPRYWVRSPCALYTPAGMLHGRLRDISAAGAFVEIRRGPSPGTQLRLEHPTAGSLEGTVVRRTEDGISLAFTPGEANVLFALHIISSEISTARRSDTAVGSL
ncbi:MAG TPA: PilZ domain-containing protein [Pedomonas sp.]|uniref:PilZ domain-containing protein n=1 Tax=Pedomonas sp. TaxID=2976421 RepID=UPI002F40BD0C